MSAQVSEPDRSMNGTGASTEQEDKSKMGVDNNSGVSGEKSAPMQNDHDKSVSHKKHESGTTHRHKYKSNDPNGTTGAQDDFMSGGGNSGKVSQSSSDVNNKSYSETEAGSRGEAIKAHRDNDLKMQGDHSGAAYQGTGKSESVKTKADNINYQTGKSGMHESGKVAHGKKGMESKSKDKSALTTMTYTQTPVPEDHTAVTVPEKVRSAFSNSYYNAKATWRQEGENYRALFKSSDKDPLETIVVFDKNGKEIVVEKELKSDACPTAISKYCSKNERIWEVHEKGMPMKYFIQEKGDRTKWFDNNGNRIYGAIGSYESHGVASHSTRPYSK
jgi:hypothetical protein